tara:strand:- start:252 stop:602 length:351 start_codon:yes stop_codon:yes gene_type:complete
MRISNIIRISLVILVFIWVSLKGQERPEMIPYILAPNDYRPDSNLELNIVLIHPYSVDVISVDVQREETLEIIYERIQFEIINPEQQNQLFKIDNKLYHLVRLPYTGISWNDRSYK